MKFNIIFRLNMSRLSRETLNLKQFLLRKEVLKLYKEFLLTISRVQSEIDRSELKQWVRSDFRRNKQLKDEEAIKMMITRGKMSLKELQSTIPK